MKSRRWEFELGFVAMFSAIGSAGFFLFGAPAFGGIFLGLAVAGFMLAYLSSPEA